MVSRQPRKRTTILDIADEVGVSRQTVVRALRGEGRISEVTRARVLEVARELNYTPNRAAQALVGVQTHTLGMALGDLRNPFYAELANSLRVEAERRDHLWVLTGRPSPDRLDTLIRQLSGHGLDGLVFFGIHFTEAQLRKLAEAVGPLVVVGASIRHPSCREIILNDRRAVDQAVKVFDGLARFRVGVLGYVGSRGLEHPRVELLRARFSGPSVMASSLSEKAGFEAAQEMLKLDPDLDGIVAFCDALGLGSIRAIRDSGRAVPEDVAVVGFDGTDAARYAGMSLTSVGFGVDRIAALALELLVDHDSPRSVELEPSVSLGDSAALESNVWTAEGAS